MSLSSLFLKNNSIGIITFSELNWITNFQLRFSRVEQSLVIKLGRLIDSGIVNICCRITKL